MPCDYSKYPKNWKSEIRPAILERANNCCEYEGCGVKNYSSGYWDKDGKFWTGDTCLDLLENTGYDIFDNGNELGHIPTSKKPVKVVLTISHQDHNTNNNDYSNLKALCQLHHLRHDVGHHKKTRDKNKGLQSLF